MHSPAPHGTRVQMNIVARGRECSNGIERCPKT